MGKFVPDNTPYIPQPGEFDLREGRTLESTCYKPLNRILLEISYDGSEYGGWQIQPNRLAVQEDMQKKLTKLYGGQFIHLIGASRTDAGVHAIGFAASFLAPVRPVIPLDKLLTALNRQLPPQVRIRSVREVPLDDGTTARVVFVQGERPENAIEISVQVDGVPEGYWPVPVEIGIQDNYNVEIKSGVQEGDVVFTQVQTAYGWG